jgi:hypothetical protein
MPGEKALTVKSPQAGREKRPKTKNDPKLRAAARDFRDVWQEKVSSGELLLPEAAGKYEVCKQIEATRHKREPVGLLN